MIKAIENINEFARNVTTGTKILAKNNALEYEIRANGVKKEIFSNACLENGKKSRILKTYSRTRWVSALHSVKRLKDLTPAIKESTKRKEFDSKFSAEDFTMIDELLLALEPFQHICELLSSYSCTVKGALPLLEFYHILLKENVIKQFKKGVVSFPERTVLIKCLQKMEKYYKIYRSNDFRLMG